MSVWRLASADHGAQRLGWGRSAECPDVLLDDAWTFDGWLAERPEVDRLLTNSLPLADLADLAGWTVLCPVDSQPVWAAGLTFRGSLDARVRETDGTPDPYLDAYVHERPELFFKALPGAARGPLEQIGVRGDSASDVPEPELGVLIDANGDIAGFMLGNDVTSRSIEGENPLYLPQAKLYAGSCALGPCVVTVDELDDPSSVVIQLEVRRDGVRVVVGDSAIADMHRDVSSLIPWLLANQEFPSGVVLLTGTGFVPAADFSLEEGDAVEICSPHLGCLRNPVIRREIHVPIAT